MLLEVSSGEVAATATKSLKPVSPFLAVHLATGRTQILIRMDTAIKIGKAGATVDQGLLIQLMTLIYTYLRYNRL